MLKPMLLGLSCLMLSAAPAVAQHRVPAGLSAKAQKNWRELDQRAAKLDRKLAKRQEDLRDQQDKVEKAQRKVEDAKDDLNDAQQELEKDRKRVESAQSDIADIQKQKTEISPPPPAFPQ